jgi:hypothetical protein
MTTGYPRKLLCHGGPGLKDWFQGDERKDRFSVEANAHFEYLLSVSPAGGRRKIQHLGGRWPRMGVSSMDSRVFEPYDV